MTGGVHVQDLVVRAGAGVRVGPVCFTLAPGEVLLIEGPNGCGKTTLLKALAGLLAAESGSITRPSHATWLPQHPENDRDVPLSIDEALALKQSTKGSRAERASERAQALAEVGFTGSARRRLATLSGGELQRVQLAGALLASAPFLLLDEATSAVDMASESHVARMLAAHAARTARMVAVVTHRPEPWRGLAHQALQLPARGREEHS